MDIDPKILKEYENNHMQFRIDRMISNDYYKEVSNIIFDAPDDPDGIIMEENIISHILKIPFKESDDKSKLKSNNPDLNDYSTYCILKKFKNNLKSCMSLMLSITAFYIPETMEQISLCLPFMSSYITTTYIDISLEKVLRDSNKIPNIDIPSYHKYGSENINIDGQIYKRFVPSEKFQKFHIMDELGSTNIYCEMVCTLFPMKYWYMANMANTILYMNPSLYYDRNAVITYRGENDIKKASIPTFKYHENKI